MSTYSVVCLLLFSPRLAVPQTTTLTVAAAADLSRVEPALLSICCKNEPARVRFVSAASGALRQQIENGAPYDVFLSANADYIEQLKSSGKVRPDSVRVYALGRLCLLFRDGKQHRFSTLAEARVRFVAVPNAKLAPYGRAAEQALKSQGLWDKVKAKLVYGENVQETLQLFDSENADAVLTSAALVSDRHPDLVPNSWHDPIRQTGAIVTNTPNLAAAQKFLDFLMSSEGQAVFAKFNYGRAQRR